MYHPTRNQLNSFTWGCHCFKLLAQHNILAHHWFFSKRESCECSLKWHIRKSRCKWQDELANHFTHLFCSSNFIGGNDNWTFNYFAAFISWVPSKLNSFQVCKISFIRNALENLCNGHKIEMHAVAIRLRALFNCSRQ